MNRTKLKNYAPQARREFIQAVTDRAEYYGLTATKIAPVTEQGDVAIIAGRAFPRAVIEKRKRLEARVRKQGFDQAMEALAYTWFNRLVAIRFMELHGYLEHGYRVLSHPQGDSTPEIVAHAEHVDLPGLDKAKVIDLKLDGSKEAELYRIVLVAQCNALSTAMPFLFERIDDETELVLPDNLLHSDSLIRKLVSEIDEADWQQVEIIGWLYQFYITEKKDQVIGKVVASEDIPAATQLFTPNWIVKYLIQNSLGRQWLATYPTSPLKAKLEYYIEPAEQTPEVQAQLKAITPDTLNPEELTLLDPACGSGHILVEAYDLFKAIYQERGYRAKDIPRLILEKNLFGLEIDDRAAQLAALALMMKARADDRRIFESEAKPNILAFHDSRGMNAADITHALNSPIKNEETPPSDYLFDEIEDDENPLFSRKALGTKGQVAKADISALLELFEDAKTLGSLIEVSPKVAATLPTIEQRLNEVMQYGDLTHTSARVIKPLLRQARFLGRHYDCVAANPPYMGMKGMNDALKSYSKEHFRRGKWDLFGVFIERTFGLARSNGCVALMTPFTWMFIESFQSLREWIVVSKSLWSLVRPEYHSFFDSAYVPICAYVIGNANQDQAATFVDLTDFYGETVQSPKLLEAINNPSCAWRYLAHPRQFSKIPGSPIAYWASESILRAFSTFDVMTDIAITKKGMATGNNARFVRLWHEVDVRRVCFDATSREVAKASGKKWFPYNDGGSFRRWYGNNESVVNWLDDGEEPKQHATERNNGGHWSRSLISLDYFFRPGVTWTAISTGSFAAQKYGVGFLFSSAGMCLFCHEPTKESTVLAALNSAVGKYLLRILSPTLNYGAGEVGRFPIATLVRQNDLNRNVEELVRISRVDWDSYETSWEFGQSPLAQSTTPTLVKAVTAWDGFRNSVVANAAKLEEENNRILSSAYGFCNEISCEVPLEQITLNRPNLQEDIRRLMSYAIGCMMGRYSLNKLGLIYAHSGNKEFDPGQYKSFPADADGIVPVMDTDWFEDDATNRFIEFVGVAWPKEHLEENLTFIAESLGSNKNEHARDTIRRHISQGFFGHHLSMYKRRPIYWLFSSGRQRAFQCLVYLHRYQEGTLARMRTEYVIPLQGKINARIDQLASDIDKAASTSHRKKLEKEREKLVKQRAELQTFDERLRHYADMRISLDLDDGVKVNYGKFGDLLAEVRAVTGGADE